MSASTICNKQHFVLTTRVVNQAYLRIVVYVFRAPHGWTQPNTQRWIVPRERSVTRNDFCISKSSQHAILVICFLRVRIALPRSRSRSLSLALAHSRSIVLARSRSLTTTIALQLVVGCLLALAPVRSRSRLLSIVLAIALARSRSPWRSLMI